MGLGRFGVGGCCLCGPDNPDDPGGGTERAGPCGWCGLYDPNENTLEMPVPPEKQCFAIVSDAFEYSRDYPRVPYWTFQVGYNWDEWQESWLHGDYHHLHQGHYIYSARNRYVAPTYAPWRNFSDKLADIGCQTPNSATGGSYEGSIALINIPPMYGNPGGPDNLFGYPYARRYENGVIVQGQTNKEDLLPLKKWVQLQFNAPREQFPRYVHKFGQLPAINCEGDDFCGIVEAFATQSSYLVNGGLGGACASGFGGYISGLQPVFRWNYPGGEESQYGLVVEYFGLFSNLSIPRAALVDGLISTVPYLPTEQIIELKYRIGDESSIEGEGYLFTPIFYKENFSLKIEVQFDNWAPDNRKCVLSVRFYVDTDIVFQKQHIIAKPGWRQDGSPTDEQSFIQSFCTGNIFSANEISGYNSSYGGAGASPWFWEVMALWDLGQTPRESYWIDNWWNQYQRL